MKCVIDTSTLISLARINCLEIIDTLKINVVLPQKVYYEAVVIGEEKGFADATVIKSFIKRYNKIKIVEVKTIHINALRKEINKVLSAGDEAVLALAVKEKEMGVITNDDGLGKIALALGFDVIATPDLLIRGLRKNILKRNEFENYMRGLVVENRLSSVVAELYLMEAINVKS